MRKTEICEEEMAGSFNAMLAKQKAEGGNIRVTTVLFDDRIEILHDRLPIAAVPPLTIAQYYARGCTALLDAVGVAIRRVDLVRKSVRRGRRGIRVIFVIMTDGLDNSSRRYTYTEIWNKVSAKRAVGWEFFFFGARIDVVNEAARLGIDRSRGENGLADV